MERADAHFGVDDHIYAAFKLFRVNESTAIRYILDYCSMIKKAMKSWENSLNEKDYKAYRAVQLSFIGRRVYTMNAIEKRIGCSANHLRKCYLNKGIEIFKLYLYKQLSKMNYTQSNNSSLIVDESFPFEQDRNLELMVYVVSNIALQSREYFNHAESAVVSQLGIHRIKPRTKDLKEVS